MKKEILLSNDNLPLKINLLDIEDIYTNWHKELKVIYIIKGNLFIDTNINQFELCENQFIFINSYDFLSIQPTLKRNTVVLEILIDNSIINRLYPDFSYIKFKCHSNNINISDEKYDVIRQLLSKILNIIFKNEAEKDLIIFNTLIELILYLVNNFKLDELSSEKDISNKNRLIKILDFLEDNYEDDSLSIHDISKYIGLSSQHLFKIFRENLGVTLTDYLNSLRVKKSLNDLIYTNKNIIEISAENGFNSSKSYHRLFKNLYQMTPGAYRKNYKENKKNFNNDIVIFEKKDILEDFSKYYSEKNEISNYLNKTELSLIELDLKKLKKVKIKHYWKKIMSLGKAVEGLKGDIQSQIKEIQSEIGFEYVRFTGVFNDEMNIYNEIDGGNITYNYAYIDKLIDFLVHLKLKPFINLGFMPKKLASKEQYIVSSSINVSYPKNITIWKDMVSKFIRHLIERYGEKEVLTWYFEIWNNPDVYSMYWYESEEKFFSFFEDTFNSIKSESSKLKVGGPSITFDKEWKWQENFQFFLENRNIEIDFFTYHNFFLKIKNSNCIKEEDIIFEESSLSKDYFKEVYEKVRQNIISKKEIIVNEWNLIPASSNILNDTCYSSSFIIDTILNNFNTVNSIIYWTFTENKVGTNIFYGGLGLFTTNNLKKASYNAFLLLSKLGNEFISKGTNYFITTTENSIQILLYNFKSEFQKKYKSKEINLNLYNFKSGKYLVTKYFLNENSGSIYDAWLKMGSPKKITEEIYQTLKSDEKMKMKIEEIIVENFLIIKEIINSNEIIFLNIEKII